MRCIVVALAAVSAWYAAPRSATACTCASREVVFDQTSDDRTPPAFEGVRMVRLERGSSGYRRSSCDDDNTARKVIALHAKLPPDTAYVRMAMWRRGDPASYWTSMVASDSLDDRTEASQAICGHNAPLLRDGEYCVSVAAIDRAGNAAGGDRVVCAFVNGWWGGSEGPDGGGPLALFAGLMMAGAGVEGARRRRRREPQARVVR